ncbi:AmmeMemoRadiSam system protein B [Aliiruegeria lutimaris]|uniref:AMMECR1 domain-containing protein n=1 Tax=Aliiruegeria lutimaris TaxID=571298 RepID=A0A1G8WBZ9_9RHOB|nr:AmmeMemoRadiSam system protein B [Aliiruegeria lutimaris]SDJ75696.1 hypothetical protein SAMN04488026_102371 [Aliiruegeria lutimaris]
MTVRSCRFAGIFFPAEGRQLAATVEDCLRAAEQADRAGAADPCAIISAHAGYQYSGLFAGLSFGSVIWRPARVVVISPSHRHWFRGLAYPSQDVFSTPLGPLEIDRAACAELGHAGLAHEEDAAHDNEHGIETQLPFIRTLWPEAKIVPLVCGDVPPEQVAAAIDALAGPNTLTVLSSDLSHFLRQDEARQKDAETARLIETSEAAALTSYHACGARGIQGWLISRAGQATKALRLGMGDSAAVSGDRSQVVGYGGWAFYPSDAAILNRKSREELLGLARYAITERLATGRGASSPQEHASQPLQTVAASFVTLTLGRDLRGCIGSLAARRPLALDVAENATGAGFRDPRFRAVTAAELRALRIKIAVLGKPIEMAFEDEEDALSRLVPGLDGVILSTATQRGVFLPAVWEHFPQPRPFLEALKLKAGLAGNYWSENVALHSFRVESFEEP